MSDSRAAQEWMELVNEVANSTEFNKICPDLIKIGIVDGDHIKYSVVAYNGGLVITPYTSQGRSDASPTFEVSSNSEVANLYLEDLKYIKGKVSEKNWLSLD